MEPQGLVIGGRFVLAERIGEGAMGLVYRARDASLGRDVALKTLRRRDPEDLYRLKREFRVLADLAHPNLVQLYDLVVEPDRCFFTMELIGGVDFVTYVRGAQRAATPGPLGREGLDRLRAVLPQLTAGLGALHAAGKLHRDVKPSNVLVTPAGHLVLLDFGLAAEQARGRDDPAAGELAGTLAYMAPEQTQGGTATTAADWYSAGVMLYEALAGRLPFTNPLVRDLVPPRAAAPDTPADLDALVTALLEPRPGDRPTATAVRRRLGLAEAATPPPPSAATVWEAPFVNRDLELAVLGNAFEASRAGRTVVLHVDGPSGIGKTALVQRFLDGLAARADPLVLAGRCYPHESIPFEALDSLVDTLSRFLVTQPDAQVRGWVPTHAEALVRLFPVLGRVRGLAAAAGDVAAALEPQELRRRGSFALRELLARIGRERSLVLWIDDLQWGDLDSAILLRDLARPPEPPPLSLLLCYRSEDLETSPLLRALAEGDDSETVPWRLSVGPLAPEQSRLLAGHVLRDRSSDPSLETIAAESGGSPFLTCELARWVAGEGARALDRPARGGLPDVVGHRVARLPEPARRLLEVVAVAGGPLSSNAAAQAAGLGREAWPVVSTLRAERLLRHGPLADEEALLETYHDRIRESVLSALGAETRRAHHRRLAEVLRARPDPDPLLLLQHYQGAGDVAEAIRFAVRAAEQAATALAFNQAARLYGLALELGAGGEERWLLLARRAECLVNAGLGTDAAECYARAAAELAARQPHDPEVMRLRRCAAEQYLRSGHWEEGLRWLGQVLRHAGVYYPASPRAAVAAALWNRLRISLRGLHHGVRRPQDVPARLLSRLDVYWSAAVGTAWIDPVRSVDFQGRHTLLALRLGEPVRLVRALSTEAANLAAIGGAGRHRRATRALVAARALAEQLDDAASIGLAGVCAGVAAFFAGRWAPAIDCARRAERILRERCTGVAWELTNSHIVLLWSLAYAGRLAELDDLLPALLREARERGDQFATSSFLASQPNSLRLLATDRLADARAQATDALAGWGGADQIIRLYYQLVSLTQADLYAGDPRAAWDRLAATWPRVRSSLVLRFEIIRSDLMRLRGLVAAGLARAGSAPPGWPRERLLRHAGRCARRVGRDDMPWCAPWAASIRAAVALARDDRPRALRALGAAATGFEHAGMALMAALARHRGGTLEGGPAGAARCAEAERWMAGERVARPAVFGRLLLPGD